MCSVKDVNQQDFVIAFAAHLKKAGKLKVPEWSEIVKTGIHKELAPCDADWYYIRCASILRRVYMDNGLGIKSLARIYGGRKRRGTKPAHFSFGSHSVARKALQSLEGIKLIVKDERGGRRITSQGQRDADRIAGQVAKRTPPAE